MWSGLQNESGRVLIPQRIEFKTGTAKDFSIVYVGKNVELISLHTYILGGSRVILSYAFQLHPGSLDQDDSET